MRFFRSTFSLWSQIIAVLFVWGSCVVAIPLNLDDPASIKSAASTVAYGMMKYYTGNNTGDVPGNLPAPYFWWEAGAMFGAMLDYYYYTGDSTYNDVTSQAMLWQVGPNKDYMTPNQTKSTGNDDQGFWGMTAMTAAEQNFPNPPADQPQWLALAQAVFNSQALRWEQADCNGGLRWQILFSNPGYIYKNSISNGIFFNLAARLAKYTGNQTYTDWAVKTWDWAEGVGLITPTYQVFDGAGITENCSLPVQVQWSYNSGVFLHGAANMYSLTNGSATWQRRLEGLLNATDIFFDNTTVMYESACETNNNCNTDQKSFKGYLSRWMAKSTILAPFLHDGVMAKLRPSALAAAASCTGGQDGVTCGQKWTNGGIFDGSVGVGQQMSALEVIQANLVKAAAPPVTASTGGTSQGDPSAGTGGNPVVGPDPSGVTTGMKVAAWFLTVLSCAGLTGMSWWILWE